MYKKFDWVYISVIILCLILGLTVYKKAEAGVVDWFFGSKTIEVVFAEEIKPVKYSLGDKVPIETIKSLISQYATSTKAYEMERTIYCESHYYNVQSNVISNGVREDSWGLVQINLYWNPSVSREQALDPEFAIKWMSERWGKTKWYGYNRITDSCNPIYQ